MPPSSTDSLSSPSPSPPPPARSATLLARHSMDNDDAHGDTASELSELTEDEEAAASKQPRRKKQSLIPPQPWDWALRGQPQDGLDGDRRRRRRSSALRAQLAPARDEEEEEDEDEEDVDADDSYGTKPRRIAPALPPAAVRTPLAGEDISDEDASDEDEDEEDDLLPVAPLPKRGLMQPNYERSEPDAEDEDEDEEDEDTPAAAVPTNVAPMVALAKAATLMDVVNVVDDTLVTAAAGPAPVAHASSITAGSNVVAQPDAASSTTSSPASSRSGTPTKLISPSKPNGDATPAPAEDAEVDVDDDADVEVETDIQPAHRAEALDALALIELKVFVVRDRLYAEKMDELAWEERLVHDGTHPEGLHLQEELKTRRDQRIQFASRKRALEIENIAKRRDAEEAAVWSTWKFQRDQLQTDMIADISRKRRKFEREQRAMQRPVPIRRLPAPPFDAPPPPTLRELVRSAPFVPDARRRRGASALAYPELRPLGEPDAKADLELIYAQRRAEPPPPPPPAERQLAYPAPPPPAPAPVAPPPSHHHHVRHGHHRHEPPPPPRASTSASAEQHQPSRREREHHAHEHAGWRVPETPRVPDARRPPSREERLVTPFVIPPSSHHAHAHAHARRADERAPGVLHPAHAARLSAPPMPPPPPPSSFGGPPLGLTGPGLPAAKLSV